MAEVVIENQLRFYKQVPARRVDFELGFAVLKGVPQSILTTHLPEGVSFRRFYIPHGLPPTLHHERRKGVRVRSDSFFGKCYRIGAAHIIGQVGQKPTSRGVDLVKLGQRGMNSERKNEEPDERGGEDFGLYGGVGRHDSGRVSRAAAGM